MPKLSSDPDNVHGSGKPGEGKPKLDAVRGKKLVSGEEILDCPATNLIACDGGRVQLTCTIKGHHKVHYDEIFSREWV